MLGDGPDPTVATDRIGFGQVSDAHTRGLREVSWLDKRETKTRLVSGRSTKERGGRGNYERVRVL